MTARDQQPTIPVGPRLQAVLAVAWRARKPVLLRGRTGIGKSDIVAATAMQLGIECKILDLSLLDPADLTGLPYVEEGRTRFAPPSCLPSAGAGILVLEELKRSGRFVRQPVLQLLSARRLNDYELPPGWSIAAAVIPDDGTYQVDALDPALEDRLMIYETSADREQWLRWAGEQGVHGAVLAVVRADERALEDVSPRTWKCVSDLLDVVSEGDHADERVVRDTLRGYLSEPRIESLLAARSAADRGSESSANALLCVRSTARVQQLAELRDGGRLDVLERITFDVLRVVSNHDLPQRASSGEFDLTRFEALLAELPANAADRLQLVFGNNPVAGQLLDVQPEQVLFGFAEFGRQAKVNDWLSRRATRHRAWALATSVVVSLDRRADIEAVRGSRAARIGLGALLAMLGPPQSRQLRDALARMKVEVILPRTMRG